MTPDSTRTALVTGAARGLGRGYALRLARMGYAVALVDVDLKSYQHVAGEQMTADSSLDEVRSLGVDAIGIEADASDFAAMANVTAAMQERWGQIDVAVCNAGGGSADLSGGAASQLTHASLDEVLRRNLHSTVATCAAVVPYMRARSTGAIVTISSQAGLVAQADGGYAHYGVAKAAVAMYTRYLAQELGAGGIRVNCLAPGFIETARVGAGMRRIGLEHFAEQTAMRRVGAVHDCTDVLELLVSPLAGYVTGQVLCVDGGLMRGPS